VRSVLALAVPCAVVAAVLVCTAWHFRVLLRFVPTLFIRVEPRLLPRLEHWHARRSSPDVLDGVLFGDSVTFCGRRERLGVRLEKSLDAVRVPTTFVSVAHVGFRPIHFYYLVDEVLAGSPDLAIIEINLRAFSPNFFTNPAMRLPSLSRKLSMARALRIRPALANEGLTLVDPLIYRLEEQLDALYLPQSVLFMGGEALSGGLTTTLRALGRAPARSELGRLAPDLLRREALLDYAPNPAHELGAQVLAELLRTLRRARVPTVMYVTPIDVERLQGLAVLDGLLIPERIAKLESAIGAAPEEWVDLHSMLPHRMFRDFKNHLTSPGCDKVAEALRDAVLRRLSDDPR
jgi:hypothetical protein